MLEFCITGWNLMLQPYLKSATTLSDIQTPSQSLYPARLRTGVINEK